MQIGPDMLPVKVNVGNHFFVIDEPVSVGGTDAMPTPYELILSALGACKGITALMYARRKNWPLQSVEIFLVHGRNHLKDCEECEGNPDARLDRIGYRISFLGDLDAAQLSRLEDIANRCPVHKTLSAGVRIEKMA